MLSGGEWGSWRGHNASLYVRGEWGVVAMDGFIFLAGISEIIAEDFKGAFPKTAF